MAASAPPPPPPTSQGPGLLPNLGKPDPSTDIYAPTEVPSQIENPGTIEDLHKKCKGILSKDSCVTTLEYSLLPLRTASRVFAVYHRKLSNRLFP